MMRGASLAMALIACVIGSVFPFLLGRHATGLNQSVLLVTMFGITGALIYGVGIRPERKWSAALIAPLTTWPVMLGGCAWLLLMR